MEFGANEKDYRALLAKSRYRTLSGKIERVDKICGEFLSAMQDK